ncbi:hypothetical protein FWG86_01325 [Candidatus Saccharibacteria bacterium]|nr:hypothetical protein [Candidatus Saccharibacteria bacterium]
MKKLSLAFGFIALFGLIVGTTLTFISFSLQKTAAHAESAEPPEPLEPTYPPITQPDVAFQHWSASNLIAHAGGALTINGQPVDYTNSREAILENYAKGHRVFEIDLDFTSDGHLVCIHFWRDLRKLAGLDVNAPITYARFQNLRFFGQYAPLDFAGLLALMHELPDIHLVIDTKFSSPASFRRVYAEIVQATTDLDPSLLARIIPQIYNPGHLELLDQVHQFPEIIYTLYRSPQTSHQVLQFVAQHPRITAVSMWGHRALAEPGFVYQLGELSKLVYAHTINLESTFAQLQNLGVFGVYTDTLH